MCPSTESRQRVRELRQQLCGHTDPYAIAAEAIEQAERYRRQIEILERGRDT
jgi:hypothetical protein